MTLPVPRPWTRELQIRVQVVSATPVKYKPQHNSIAHITLQMQQYTSKAHHIYMYITATCNMYMYIKLILKTFRVQATLQNVSVLLMVKLDRSSSLDKMIRELNLKLKACICEYRSRVGYAVPALELG